MAGDDSIIRAIVGAVFLEEPIIIPAVTDVVVSPVFAIDEEDGGANAVGFDLHCFLGERFKNSISESSLRPIVASLANGEGGELLDAGTGEEVVGDCIIAILSASGEVERFLGVGGPVVFTAEAKSSVYGEALAAIDREELEVARSVDSLVDVSSSCISGSVDTNLGSKESFWRRGEGEDGKAAGKRFSDQVGAGDNFTSNFSWFKDACTDHSTFGQLEWCGVE